MGDQYVLPPEELPPYDPRVAAQDVASQYLASQGVAGYTPASAPASTAVPPAPGGQSTQPIGPPAPPAGVSPPLPPNGKPSIGSRVAGGLKDAGVLAAGGLLGPIGSQLAGGYVSSKNAPPAPPNEEQASGLPPGAIGAPPPPEGPGLPLIDRGAAGGGRMVAPAGMYPHSLTTQVHMGRQVPEESKRDFGIATAAQLHGADLQADADRDYYHQVRDLAATKLQANEDAATQHAAIQARRDDMVAQRLDQIEALNAEASAAIDPDKYWHDRGAGAQVIGAIAVALGQFSANLHGGDNGAAKIIESGINREIAAQQANRQLAKDKVGHAQNLLNLHLQQLGDMDKAVDATKLGLYDNVLTQMDQYAAENKARVSEAALLNAKGAILEKRGDLVNKMGLQEQNDIQKTGVDQYRPAQYAGGPSAGKSEGGGEYLPVPVPASDGTKATTVLVPKDVHKELSEMQGMTNALVDLNNKAMRARRQLREVSDPGYIQSHPMDAMSKIATLRKELAGYNDVRATLSQKSRDSSVVREPEFKREMENQVDYTSGLLGRNSPIGEDAEKLIQANSNNAQSLADARLRGAAGQEAKQVIGRDKRGFIVNEWAPTGGIYRGRDVPPEKK